MSFWPPRGHIGKPPGLQTFWQHRLDEIWGLNPYGQPMLHLVWMADEKTFHREKWIHKYPACSTKPRVVGYEKAMFGPNFAVTGWVRLPPDYRPEDDPNAEGQVRAVVERRTIGIPRWGIEQWVGPNIACQDWDRHAMEAGYDSTKGIFRTIEIMGERPSQGLYQDAFWVIAAHSTTVTDYKGTKMCLCCIERAEQGKKCYGLIGPDGEDRGYRPPDERDLTHLRLLKGILDAEPLKYAYDELPDRNVIEQAVKDDYRRLHDLEEADDVEFEEMVRADLAEKAKHFTTVANESAILPRIIKENS
jgi:hypothetical protein